MTPPRIAWIVFGKGGKELASLRRAETILRHSNCNIIDFLVVGDQFQWINQNQFLLRPHWPWSLPYLPPGSRQILGPDT